MKKIKINKSIIIALIISIAVSFFLELFFNRKVLLINRKEEAKIVELNGIEKKGKYYKTIDKNAYVVLKIQNEYADRINFNYEVKKDILWSIEYNDEKVSHSSSSLINKVERNIKRDIPDKTIKIVFNKKNVRFGNFYINNKIAINWSRLFIVCLLLFCGFIIVKYRKYLLNNLEKAFLIIGLVAGISMIIITPKNVYVSWDDQIHIKNAYSFVSSENIKFSSAFKLATIHYKVDGDCFQTQSEKIEMYKKLNELHKKTKNEETQLNNYSSKYTKLVYFPFYLGFKLSEFLNLNYVMSFIIAKLFNFLCYIFLMYQAIKISKHSKKIIFFISLFVSNIFLATQFSYDPTIIASMILAISLFIRILEEKELNVNYLIYFILCIIWASLPKAIYCPMLLLLLFIPNEKFNSKKQARLFKIIVICITLLLMSTFILPMLTGSVTGDPRGGDTNAGEQFKLILSSPINYCKILLKFFLINGMDLVIGEKTFINLAYFNSYVELIIPLIYLVNFIFLMYLVFREKQDEKVISPKIKVVFMCIYVIISILIATALYISFTPVGSTEIAGVQTRYFIPMLLMLLFVIMPTANKIKIDLKYNNILLLLIPYLSIMLTNFMIVYKTFGI